MEQTKYKQVQTKLYKVTQVHLLLFILVHQTHEIRHAISFIGMF